METALVRPALEQDSLPAAHGRQGRGTWLRRLQGAGYAGGDVQIADPSPNNWFNEAAFKTAPADRLGSAGTGIIVGPGQYLWDLTVRKEFRITERVKARFEAQSFNLMNHPNFRGLNVTTTGSAFNTVSSAGPARNIQFGLKLNF